MKNKRDGMSFADYTEHFRKKVLPQIKGSSFFIALAPSTQTLDIRMATEIGACIMLDKPLIVIAPRGQVLHERLMRVADHVIYGDPKTNEGRAEIEEQLRVYLNQ